jgi:ABC-type sugar transport system ATPase subunit
MPVSALSSAPAVAAPAPALAAEGVVVRYGAVTALDGVTVHVPAGACAALVGESGSGKTTLLRCFNALVRPDAGRVRVGGAEVSALDAVALRRAAGYVPQDGGLLPHWTVRRNVALVPDAAGRSPAPRRRARRRRRSRSSGSTRVASPAATRTSCRAASGSAWPWRARSPAARASSSSTSRSARSTRSRAPTRRRRSPPCAPTAPRAASRSRPCWSRTTCARRAASPT